MMSGSLGKIEMNKKLNKNRKGFSLVELMTVIVIIGILVSIALPNFLAAQDRARYASVKNSMHIVQVAAETYSFSFGATFPGKVDQLINHAKTSGLNYYWKDLLNPFTKSIDPVNDISSINTINDATAGNVYYAGSQSTIGGYTAGLFPPIDRGTYIIYAVDRNRTFLTQHGKVFYLNNNSNN
jgi:prepilin-type N-terminal cleavage/methylation domain-containing protein